LYQKLDIPLSNWSYVNFTSRANTDFAAVDVVMNITGIMIVSDINRNPFIIIAHGIHSCKEDINVMIPAALLWRAGFNVLLIDLRYNALHSQSGQYPFQTYGHQEHWDVLGAIDFLVALHPSLANGTRVGLYGVGMGGAATTIAFARDDVPVTGAMWLDSPTLDVFGTISYYITGVGLSYQFMMASICSIATSLWPFGCPPFQYDPLVYAPIIASSNTTRSVFFVSKTDDTISPLFNDVKGSQIMSHAGVNVSTWYVTDPTPSACSHHGDSLFYDPSAYEKTMILFFNGQLRRK
jgi:hypothetical protein